MTAVTVSNSARGNLNKGYHSRLTISHVRHVVITDSKLVWVSGSIQWHKIDTHFLKHNSSGVSQFKGYTNTQHCDLQNPPCYKFLYGLSEFPP